MNRDASSARPIWVLAGTTEGREAVSALARGGFDVVATTATPQGAELIGVLGLGVRVETGALDGTQMSAFIATHNVVAIVDATHPFAVNASANARAAAEDTGIAYLRFERPDAGSSKGDEKGVVRVSTFEEAAEKAVTYGSRIFLTVGVRHLEVFTEAARQSNVDVVARVLPWTESVERCAELGLGSGQVVAAQPPFSVEDNLGHFKKYGASVIVTKDSGPSGGLAEKVEAARVLGIPVIIVDRPGREGELVFDGEQLLEVVQKWGLT